MTRRFLTMLFVFLAATPLAAQEVPTSAEPERTFGERLSTAAIERTRTRVTYDPSYVQLGYPGGDVPADRGVCADVVVRVLRTQGIDLQKLIHEDMRTSFNDYPSLWGLKKPDRNIDHRRVPNIERYLARRGAQLPASHQPADYKPGDVVAYNLRGDAGFLPHIGVVTDKVGASGWPLIVHNIGAGPRLEDVLFAWPITGHYRLQKSGA